MEQNQGETIMEQEKIISELSKIKTNHALKIYKMLLENNGKVSTKLIREKKIKLQSGVTVLRNRGIADYSDRNEKGIATTVSLLKG